MTQYERVLEHLKKKGKINQKTAINLYGCYRLSAVIYNLKKDGYNITATTKTGKNRYKEPTHWTEYEL